MHKTQLHMFEDKGFDLIHELFVNCPQTNAVTVNYTETVFFFTCIQSY